MALTNREAFFKAKELISKSEIKVSDSEIYELLIFANDYSSYSDIVMNFESTLKNEEQFFVNLNRVICGEPIQYVLNVAPFLDFDFYVDSRVLIPRPETEGLVLLVKNFIVDNKIRHKTIADLCTGSGCIAIYMKAYFEDSNVYATDIHDECLDVAKMNAKKFKADINFLKGNMSEPLFNIDERIDILISNPPYAPNDNEIEEKVKKYEPINAIVTEGGVTFYEDYFKNYKKFMSSDKFLMAFEINYDEEAKLTELINKYFDNSQISFKFFKDIYNLTRYLIIMKGYKKDVLEEVRNW